MQHSQSPMNAEGRAVMEHGTMWERRQSVPYCSPWETSHRWNEGRGALPWVIKSGGYLVDFTAGYVK